jgi:hypothetical protein
VASAAILAGAVNSASRPNGVRSANGATLAAPPMQAGTSTSMALHDSRMSSGVESQASDSMVTVPFSRPGCSGLHSTCTVNDSLGARSANVGPTTAKEGSPATVTFDTVRLSLPKLEQTALHTELTPTSWEPNFTGDGEQRRMVVHPPS